ncbi:hypothetical protein BOO22_10800 [Vibrio cidicii]|uniref:hypothetical protein n=1 Tax=Vibrio cidicii TaxID=1763883 RepID=UPI0018C24B0D|nr:hypothetical protein [Vibrio cidicii]MBG0759910.1 hypothetical protein [Vibrio cidicii]
MNRLFIMTLLVLSGCQSTQIISNEELDEVFRDIATYNVDLGTSGILLMSGDYIDSYETYEDSNVYRVRLVKEKTGYIDRVMQERCSSAGGEVYIYRGIDPNQRVAACELKTDKDHQIFGYGTLYEPIQKASFKGWVLTYYELNNSTTLPQNRFPNFTTREVKLAEKKEQQRKEKEYKLSKQQKELTELKQRSLDTRSQVLTKGTRICSVSIDNQIVAYTEDSTDKKIKVVVGYNTIWDWPDNWYACDKI